MIPTLSSITHSGYRNIGHEPDDTEVKVAITTELTSAARVRRRLRSLADEIEDDPCLMLWFKGRDKDDVVTALREMANYTDADVERIAEEVARDRVNEGVV